MNDNLEELKETEKEKLILETEDLETTPSSQPATKQHNPEQWTGGLILIGIGLFFLLSNVANFSLHNWWALFILVPGLSKLIHAGQLYREHGRFNHRVRQAFTWSIILILVACTFLFSWSWGAIWPLFLVVIGLGVLLSGLLG